MNKIINKFLLTGDKFMPEMHLRQPGFTYSAADHLLKTEKTQKIKEKENSRYTHQNEVDKACFEYGLTYGDFKDLLRRTASVKLLRDKSFNIAKNPKYVGYQRHLASMVYSFFFDKKTTSGSRGRSEIMSNRELAEKQHKPTATKSKKQKVQSSFIDNIQSAD